MRKYYDGIGFNATEECAFRYDKKVDAFNDRNQLKLFRIDTEDVIVVELLDHKYALAKPIKTQKQS